MGEWREVEEGKRRGRWVIREREGIGGRVGIGAWTKLGEERRSQWVSDWKKGRGEVVGGWEEGTRKGGW